MDREKLVALKLLKNSVIHIVYILVINLLAWIWGLECGLASMGTKRK